MKRNAREKDREKLERSLKKLEKGTGYCIRLFELTVAHARFVHIDYPVDGKKLEIDGKELVPTEKPNHKRKKIDEEKSEGEISEGDEEDEEKRNPKDNVENI